MIVKNEVENLSRLLPKIGGLFDEFCVCDTGSNDGTQELLAKFGARYTQKEWRDSFGWARNQALGLATAQFAIWLDADDDFSPDEFLFLRKTLETAPENTAFLLRLYTDSPDPARKMTCNQLRIHPILPGIAWERRIHEQVIPSCHRAGCRIDHLPFTVVHTGYDRAEGTNVSKYERNLRLLRMEETEMPHDVTLQFHIAQSLLGLHRDAEALVVLQDLAKIESPIEYEMTIAARCSLLAANLIKFGAERAQVELLERAVTKAPNDDLARISLAERYAMTGSPERVRKTLEPISLRGSLQESLMPYPMAIAQDVAERLWAGHR